MQNNRKIIYLAGFLFSLPVALATYINSTFLSAFVGEKLVGIVYTFASIGSVLALLIAPKIFRKIGAYKFLLLTVFLDAMALFFISFANNKWSAILVFILFFSLNTVIFFSLDELLKIFSLEADTGKTRGAYMALSNLAWILALLGTGTILGGISFRMIYLVGFVIMLLFFFLSYFSLRRIPDPIYDKKNVLAYMEDFFENKNLFRAYTLSFLIQFFYCWMTIYTPIYLSLHLGFSWSQIGIMFAIMILPFSIIPFKIGKYSDKIGERKMLMLGFTIITLSTLYIFFIHKHEFWMWALVLFITRIGASIIEEMSDIYFFKHTRMEDENLLGVYRSAPPVAYIFGPLVAFFVLLYVPSFKFIFLILGAVMFLGIYISSGINRMDV